MIYRTFWRRVRDSNPRFLLGTQHFECCRLFRLWVILQEFDGICRKIISLQFADFYFKSVQINELSNGFEPNLVLSQSMKKVENSGSFSPILVHFEDVGENFGENEKAQLSAW